MTGEMSWIKPNGEDSNGDVYEVHAQVARAMRCTWCVRNRVAIACGALRRSRALILFAGVLRLRCSHVPMGGRMRLLGCVLAM